MSKNIILTAAMSAILAASGFAQATAPAGQAAKQVKSAKDKAADKASQSAGSAKETAKGGAAGKGAAAKTAQASDLAPGVTAADIANAQAKGMVWVNTNTGVYHRGGEHYGATKAGKFMTEAEAKKGGYKASKSEGAKKKTS